MGRKWAIAYPAIKMAVFANSLMGITSPGFRLFQVHRNKHKKAPPIVGHLTNERLPRPATLRTAFHSGGLSYASRHDEKELARMKEKSIRHAQLFYSSLRFFRL